MNFEIEKLFSEQNIEYFSALAYSDLRQIRPDIALKCGFLPKSAIIFLLPYYSGETVNLSRYASSIDYHIVIKEIGGKICEGLRELYPENSFFCFGDHSPIDERHAALTAGLGVLGENGLLINEEYGSYVFIAEILTDLYPEKLPANLPTDIKKCFGCGECVRACPTGKLTGRGECLSEITQRRGELSEKERKIMKKVNTVWGCDLCQSHCPYNKHPKTTPLSYFLKDRIEYLTKEGLASMSKEEFHRRAFSWRGRKTVMRNIEAVED